MAVEGAPFDVVLNLVSTSPEDTEALIGVVADGGFHVGTMTSGPEAPKRQGSARNASSFAATPLSSRAW